jgi:hypothetical protein
MNSTAKLHNRRFLVNQKSISAVIRGNSSMKNGHTNEDMNKPLGQRKKERKKERVNKKERGDVVRTTGYK